MPNVARMVGMAVKRGKKIGRRLYRIETKGTSPEFRSDLNTVLGRMPLSYRTRRMAAKVEAGHASGKSHYFTKPGWDLWGRRAYKKLVSFGYTPKITHKRGGMKIDRWQAMAGAAATAFGLGTRRRSKRRGRRM